ncbi:unnamed protein product [Protopolystoma xenopodis]|uniref:Uncharacterized protein n=1 Tax=Protopolystoma xenopodis TaxID=117903 RepID=A0A3S5A5G0_9PLAT|nr:unnamed protein product [Protopolystoma xenopodis]
MLFLRQDLSQQHTEKKSAYQALLTSEESHCFRLETQASQARESARSVEDRFHYLIALRGLHQVQQFRVQEEMRSYVTGGALSDASGGLTPSIRAGDRGDRGDGRGGREAGSSSGVGGNVRLELAGSDATPIPALAPKLGTLVQDKRRCLR